MSQKEVECFLGRLITDAAFRRKASLSVRSACSTEGISLSPEEITFMQCLDFGEFGAVAESIDDSIRRS